MAGEPPKSAADKPAESAASPWIIGEPIRYANLTVFPISSRTPRTQNRFITLDEGLKAGTVTVVELGAQIAANEPNAAGNAAPNANPAVQPAAQPPAQRATNSAQQQTVEQQSLAESSADVNQLALLNRSGKPLYLMPGEIIVGGRQDRTIAQEYVIPPGNKPVTIEVFCVEHGRWAGRGAMETTTLVNGANASPTLAQTNGFGQGPTASPRSPAAQPVAGSTALLQEGKFIGSVGNVNKAARIAVQHDKDQQKVWDRVAEVNAKNSVKTQSGDFAGNYVEKEAVERLEPFIKALNKQVAGSANVIGVAVAIDGKMDTVDVFESTPLFRQLWPKLLKSYALDAVNAAEDVAEQKPSQKSAKKPDVVCSVADARKFLTEAMSAQKEQSTTNGAVTVTTQSTEHIVSFSAQDSSRNRGSAGSVGGGGFGGNGSIHFFGGAF